MFWESSHELLFFCYALFIHFNRFVLFMGRWSFCYVLLRIVLTDAVWLVTDDRTLICHCSETYCASNCGMSLCIPRRQFVRISFTKVTPTNALTQVYTSFIIFHSRLHVSVTSRPSSGRTANFQAYVLMCSGPYMNLGWHIIIFAYTFSLKVG